MYQISNRYKLIRCLGKGKTSFVFEAQKVDNPTIQVAIKEYKSIKADQAHQNHPLFLIFQKEAMFLQAIDNLAQQGKATQDYKHINKLVEILKLGNEASVTYLLVLEFAMNGNLTEFLCENPWLPEQIAQAYIFQLTKALKILHDLNVSHMDIKPENMLLDEKFILKLTDFGLIEFQQESNECHGTKGYMAPEVQTGQMYSPKKADIFSLGCSFIAIRSGVNPFGDGQLDMNNPIYISLLNDPKSFWTYFEKFVENENNVKITIEEEFKDLIERMLTNVPEKRPSIDQVLQHPYLNKQHVSDENLIGYMKSQFLQKNVYSLASGMSQGEKQQQTSAEFEIEQLGYNSFIFRNHNDNKNFTKTVKNFMQSIIIETQDLMFENEIEEEYRQQKITYLIKQMENNCRIGIITNQDQDKIRFDIIGLEGSTKDQIKVKKLIRDGLKQKIKKLDQQNQ